MPTPLFIESIAIAVVAPRQVAAMTDEAALTSSRERLIGSMFVVLVSV